MGCGASSLRSSYTHRDDLNPSASQQSEVRKVSVFTRTNSGGIVNTLNDNKDHHVLTAHDFSTETAQDRLKEEERKVSGSHRNGGGQGQNHGHGHHGGGGRGEPHHGGDVRKMTDKELRARANERMKQRMIGDDGQFTGMHFA